jgi:hypothetical protein
MALSHIDRQPQLILRKDTEVYEVREGQLIFYVPPWGSLILSKMN